MVGWWKINYSQKQLAELIFEKQNKKNNKTLLKPRNSAETKLEKCESK